MCTNQKTEGRTCCANSGGVEYFDYMKLRLLELGLHGPNEIRISKSGCLGRCPLGPCMVIYPEGVWYTYASFEDIEAIITSHLLAGELYTPLLIDKE
jgi:(2Fe-2S) ferredoxin